MITIKYRKSDVISSAEKVMNFYRNIKEEKEQYIRDHSFKIEYLNFIASSCQELYELRLAYNRINEASHVIFMCNETYDEFICLSEGLASRLNLLFSLKEGDKK